MIELDKLLRQNKLDGTEHLKTLDLKELESIFIFLSIFIEKRRKSGN